MSRISKSLGRRRSGYSESLWLCAVTASACLADTALLPLPASWNSVSQLQLPGSAPGASFPQNCGVFKK